MAGIVPALACDVTYGFGAQESSVKLRGGGRFTALGVFSLLLISVTTFPWAGLAARFAECWRDPRLTRWQRRVLLP
jgi:threonine/homoserine/homoserine lactone efflux protein